ncbi:nickel uptake transporter family protein [Sphingomonas sp. Leaf231]|uniref:nickel uptake transporter family protein n=1 Tax=Sphingomonas sp. Leaf231 TaxID=1736301 RepID=UPI000700EDA0|nr:nickel uptake transporter family protein [Sphingomonas sp. Leaf231]KQN94380.1 nickel uptake transporter family protein [Sphingomonas sp. Leaf231]
MRLSSLAAVVLAMLPSVAGAHEIWIERDAAGPARIYLGEPGEAPPPGGDPEFAKLQKPRLLGTATAPLVRRAGFLEAAVPAGDVRLWDDTVFAPWGPTEKREGVVYYARAGREQPVAALPFELVPVAPNASRFILTRDRKPVANTAVTLFAPDRAKTELRTDAAGMVAAPTARPGRYLLVAAARDDGPATLPGGPVHVVHHITTTSFVAP